ncbi:MAG TPA: hypothetical protein ENH41_04735 [Candidatus Omnitrophica bacterium]|nr:hypothetical protein [Candidatus Omnitrophota bacterium]
MPQAAIKKQTAFLKELQTIDTQIYNFKGRLDEIPLVIVARNKEFQEQKTGLNELEEKQKRLLLARKDKEIELGGKEENMKKLQGQLYQLKTNKEYTAMMKEMDGLKADNSRIEDAILDIMLQLDVLKNDVNKEKTALDEKEKVLNAEKIKLSDEQKGIDQKMAVLNGKHKQIAENIDRKILKIYERILKGKDGLALVKVIDGSCQGCFMNVRPQTVNEIRMYERIITCEMCSRILYEDDD